MATLNVGFGQQYSTVSSAIAASKDGDVVQVQAGTYVNDFAEINTKITLQGVGGMVKMVAFGYIPNDKGIFITNTDVTIDHFEFSGATGSSQNDAGIRYQSGNLTITNSYFHDNQNGLLANPWSTGTITIQASEFERNGIGDGRTHNIYVTEIARLTITDSYSHDAVVGHEIKSRAAETIITNTRAYDNSSDASYTIDLPNGGHAVLTNNVIQQGANTDNSNIVSFGVEGNVHAGGSLVMTGTTLVNDLVGGNFLISPAGGPVTVTNTQVWSVPQLRLTDGPNITMTGTTTLASRPVLDMSHPFAASTTGNLPGSGVYGTAANDTIMGTAASENINGGDGTNYIRGAEGNDKLQGGTGFDDLNGNQGNDTVSGGAGNDWVVGGQGNDYAFGDEGDDIVYGNLGNDSLQGESGNDTIRGGQGNDWIWGGVGNDWISGDLGDDSITGDAGADVFHTWGEAGIDRVFDFDPGGGDRVMVDLGTTYSYAASGGNVVISMSGGAQMILYGVSMSWLTGDWIFQA
jgi:Ca2+-binding RTX toxin-like protein